MTSPADDPTQKAVSPTPPDPAEREAIRQVLVTEASQLLNTRQTGLATGDRVYAIAVSLAGVAIALLASNSTARYLALPIPFLLCLLMSYQLQILSDVKAAGVYRAYLEDAINDTFRSRILGFENGAVRSRYVRSATYTAVIIVVALLALSVATAVLCIQLFGWASLAFGLYAIATVAALVGVAWSAADEQKAGIRAELVLRRYLTKP